MKTSFRHGRAGCELAGLDYFLSFQVKIVILMHETCRRRRGLFLAPLTIRAVKNVDCPASEAEKAHARAGRQSIWNRML